MGAERIAGHCAGLRAGERALVLCDPGTRAVGEALAGAARVLAGDDAVQLLEIPALRMHGDEPPGDAAAAMLRADVVFGATAFSLAHARARAAATAAGTRYLSLPDLTPERLASPALDADFRALTPLADAYASRFTNGSALTIRTRAGTHLRCAIGGRTGNAAPGWTDAPGGLASPPDAEANVAPLEDGSDGVIVVDGSIPHPDLGLLGHAVEIVVRAGRVIDVAGPGAPLLRALFGAAPENAVVAEIGVGLNPCATLSGAMLEDEGCAGTVHVGIGGNTGLGGANAASFHLDHVLRAPTLEVDGERLIDAGTLALCPEPPSP